MIYLDTKNNKNFFFLIDLYDIKSKTINLENIVTNENLALDFIFDNEKNFYKITINENFPEGMYIYTIDDYSGLLHNGSKEKENIEYQTNNKNIIYNKNE